MTRTTGPLSAAVDGARTLQLATGCQAGRDDDNGLTKPGDSGCRALGGLILEAVSKAILAATVDPRMRLPIRVARPGATGGVGTTRKWWGSYSQGNRDTWSWNDGRPNGGSGWMVYGGWGGQCIYIDPDGVPDCTTRTYLDNTHEHYHHRGGGPMAQAAEAERDPPRN